MEMYGIFRIKRKVTVPRVAEYLVGMFSFEYPYYEICVWVQNSGTLTSLIHGYFLNMGTFLFAELYGNLIISLALL